MIQKLSKRLAIVTLLAGTPCIAMADTTESEINFLLDAVGSSGCNFVRNGKQHSPEDARDHLAMKYRRGKKHAKTAELFIERLASESSWTGNPYKVACPDEPKINSGDWLTAKLNEYRDNP